MESVEGAFPAGPLIAVICQQRHQRRWCTFSQPAYFFHREHKLPCALSQISDAQYHVSNILFQISIDTKYTTPINTYAKKHQEHQSKEQVRHLNQKNPPIKTPSTPS